MQAVVGALRVNLGLDSAQFKRGLQDAQGALRSAGKSMQRVGKNLSVAVTAPLVGFGALAVKTAGDFEASMNQVAAVSGATGDQLESLRDVAKDLGATTQFSASQAADAMKFLAQAGFSADETIAALPGTLQLAASAAIDLGSAADIVSNVLSGYGLEIAELARVNDVLVKTFTSSNTNLQDLGLAMQYVGPVAAAAGVQFEEAAAALGLLGNAGIQGSTAGTTLRGALSRILNPTKEAAGVMEELGIQLTDSQGKVLPLAEVLDQLAPFANDAGLFMELFGQRAGPGMAALVSQGSGALRELTQELETSGGTAQRISEAQMQGFNGAVKELRSAFEALQIAIAESGLLDFITDMVKGLAEVVRSVSSADPKLLKLGTIFAALAAAIGPVLVAMGAVVAVLGTISAPVLAVVAAVSALTAAVVAFWPELVAAKDAVLDFANSVIDAHLKIADMIVEVFATLPGQMVQIGREILDGLLQGLQDKYESVKESITGFGQGVIDGFKDTFGIKSPSRVFKEIGTNIMLGLGDGLSETGKQVQSTMRGVTGALHGEVRGLLDGVLFEGASFKSALGDLFGSLSGRIFDNATSGLTDSLTGLIPGFAMGTDFAPGGLAMVGERGPELVNLPRGSQVVPNHQLGGMVINQNLTVNAGGMSDPRAIADVVRPVVRQETLAVIARVNREGRR